MDEINPEKLFELAEGITDQYRCLVENPRQIVEWKDEFLLSHFLSTRTLIEVNDNPFQTGTNSFRMNLVFLVSSIERNEILRRMR